MLMNLIRQLLPGMLIQAAAIPVDDKRAIASVLNDLTRCYLENDRIGFENLMDHLAIPVELRAGIMRAVWAGASEGKRSENQSQRTSHVGRENRIG